MTRLREALSHPVVWLALRPHDPRRPLIVGEMNPLGGRDAFALFPVPRSRSGGRLATFLGLSDEEYLRRFDRANLCRGAWSDRAARATARRLSAAPRPAYVLLGEKVCAAFGVDYAPFTVDERPGGGTFAVLPHPSGLNRMWNAPDSTDLARATVAAATGL